MMSVFIILFIFVSAGFMFIAGTKLILRFFNTSLMGVPVIFYSAALLIIMTWLMYYVFRVIK